MAVIYRDETNKYDLNWDIYQNLSNTESWFSSFITPIEGAINNGINSILSWVGVYQKESNKKKQAEWDFFRLGDSELYESEESRTKIIVLAIVACFIIYFIINRKKK